METEQRIGIVNTQESTPKSKEDKFKNTIAFLKAAIAEGAHSKKPFGKSNRWNAEDEWAKQKNIIGIYFGSPATLEEIGRMYGVTRAIVKDIKKRGMRNLWGNCSSEIQELFPFQELALIKPRSQKSRERSSKAHGGISVSIRNQVASGKSVKQIREEGNYSTRQIDSARKILKKWGAEELAYINVPSSLNLELEKNLKNAETDLEKQELLNQVKRRFYQDHIKGDDPLFVSIGNAVSEAGFIRGRQGQNFLAFITSLKNAKFPMGEIQERITAKTEEEKIRTYHFALAKDKERAKQILLIDPNLQKLRDPKYLYPLILV